MSVDSAGKADLLRQELSRRGETRADGLPKSLAARLLYWRLAQAPERGTRATWRRFGLTAAGVLLRLAGLEKRYTAHFD